jgi:hypothetical protein
MKLLQGEDKAVLRAYLVYYLMAFAALGAAFVYENYKSGRDEYHYGDDPMPATTTPRQPKRLQPTRMPPPLPPQ